MATSAHTRLPRPLVGVEAVVPAAYALGALSLAGEAAVHVQQFADLFHGVRWIGPLFLANAGAIVVVIAGLALDCGYERRPIDGGALEIRPLRASATTRRRRPQPRAKRKRVTT